MSEDKTKNLMPEDQPTGEPTFEERVMMRLDSIDSRLSGIDVRLTTLETKVEDRLKDTRPLWERALAEILEVKTIVRGYDRKLDILNRGLLDLRAEHEELAERVPKPEVTQ